MSLQTCLLGHVPLKFLGKGLDLSEDNLLRELLLQFVSLVVADWTSLDLPSQGKLLLSPLRSTGPWTAVVHFDECCKVLLQVAQPCSLSLLSYSNPSFPERWTVWRRSAEICKRTQVFFQPPYYRRQMNWIPHHNRCPFSGLFSPPPKQGSFNLLLSAG